MIQSLRSDVSFSLYVRTTSFVTGIDDEARSPILRIRIANEYVNVVLAQRCASLSLLVSTNCVLEMPHRCIVNLK